MNDSLRPSGTVERICDLCNWSSWYDPLSPEATIVPFVCLPCRVNEITGVVCSSCNRWFTRGHRDLALTPVDSVSGMIWFRCDDCCDVPVGVLADVRYCQGFKEPASALDGLAAATCGKVSYVRTSAPGQPDYFVDLCFECLAENRRRKSLEVRSGEIPLSLPPVVWNSTAPPPVDNSFTSLQQPGIKKLMQENLVNQVVEAAKVAQFFADPYPPRSPWKAPSWRERARHFVRAKWDRLRYRVGCMIAGVPLDDDDGGC